ncbi:BZ3500_MvSof-1268-A1-R1_Chr3-3g06490 [Microbotryum saponariae]|uniref:Autophagy-related protein 9 n=1 Tax=Microbotryum saponariae TaxID=289078 RepID=A0A2X0NH46_9BASI|nr:BZ3500_MvSof-1268-A1-R1_Chr3-3g06490 [Microbotryum saponariae]SDA04457.1 BZ3501_MvSof-1269-A2-R1_Chr3-2g06177 [Microbotryum saponariae]
MAQKRMEAALGSIFLPRDSVYAHLDDDLDEEDGVGAPLSPSQQHHHHLSPPAHAPRHDPVEANASLDTDDPFASPSQLHQALQHDNSPSSNSVRPFDRSTRRAADAPTAAMVADPTRAPITTTTSALMESRTSPFLSDQIPSPSEARPSPQQPQSSASAISEPPPLTPPTATPSRSGHATTSASPHERTLAGHHLSESMSTHNSPSLMHLLSGQRIAEASPRRLSSPGSTHRPQHRYGTEQSRDLREAIAKGDVLSLSESRALAASLPPPPSALSPPSSHMSDQDDIDDEDEDDDEAPPDFTTRVPLMSSQKKRVSSSAKSTASSWVPSHDVRLGGRRSGPRRGILGTASTASAASEGGSSRRGGGRRMAAKERALWRWINVEDLDGFLQQVYIYYVGKGIVAIGLSRLLNLLTVGWVIAFSTFLMGCIDYSILWNSHHLSEVVVSKCISRLTEITPRRFSGFTFLIAVSFTAFYFWRIVRFGMGVGKLWEMHEFFTELLEIPENDIQAIPWHAIVTRLSALRATHPAALSSRSHPATESQGGTPSRLDAHDVANRIMREENFLIALFNKDVLDLSIPLPSLLDRLLAGRSPKWGASMLTQTLEWNLSFCLVGFLFGRDGQVRRAFLMEKNKKELVEALRRRFILMGLINAVFAPFIVIYLLMYSFFRYFEEYHKNPSSIGSRQFTPLARWKFREFNELPHLFGQRLAQAHPLADSYINQYPKARTALISRFVAFLAGSFAAVLILFSLIDPDAFLHFEITPGRTVLFYIGVFGTILAVARGMVPDDHKIVDPAETMRELVQHTHYLPNEWKDNLHSSGVHAEFGSLFQMKIALFVKEILSVIVTPFVLWYTLPRCAGPIVDFFREFTIHVDGLGYVCSFAVFDFKRHGDTKVRVERYRSLRATRTRELTSVHLVFQFGAPVQVRDERFQSTEGKMEKSLLTFAAHNPAWVPRDQTQSLFLSRMIDVTSPTHRPGSPSFGASGGGVGGGMHLGVSTSHLLGQAQAHPRFMGSSLLSPPLHHRTTSNRTTTGAGQGVVGAGAGNRSFADLVEEGASTTLEPRANMTSSVGGSRIFTNQPIPTGAARRGGYLHVGEPSRNRPTPLNTPRVAARMGQAIDKDSEENKSPILEESRLDGEAFVARFDGSSSAHEEGVGEGSRAGDDLEGGGRDGVKGMLGELYNLQGKKW